MAVMQYISILLLHSCKKSLAVWQRGGPSSVLWGSIVPSNQAVIIIIIIIIIIS